MLVMLVDPDGERARRMSAAFHASGYEVDYAAHARTALTIMGAQPWDAAVIAMQLADGSGLDLCRRLRAKGAVYPIVLLSEDASVQAIVDGLDAGADDVFRAPVDLAELQAKLQSMWARARQPRRLVLEWGDVQLDVRTRTVSTAVGTLALARYPYQLLRVLMEAAPAAVPFSRIELQLWPDEADRAGARRTHAYALRKALRSHASRVVMRTHQGYGYSLWMAGE